jgi:hypothetical protein
MGMNEEIVFLRDYIRLQIHKYLPQEGCNQNSRDKLIMFGYVLVGGK